MRNVNQTIIRLFTMTMLTCTIYSLCKHKPKPSWRGAPFTNNFCDRTVYCDGCWTWLDPKKVEQNKCPVCTTQIPIKEGSKVKKTHTDTDTVWIVASQRQDGAWNLIVRNDKGAIIKVSLEEESNLQLV